MRSNDTGLEMTLADIAGSVIRVWALVTGSEPESVSEGDAGERWVGACRWAVPNLPGFDGHPVSDAVSAFLDQWASGDESLRKEQDLYPVEWEAVVRHLNALLDSDELQSEDDVRALEQSWAAWAQRRPRRVEGR